MHFIRTLGHAACKQFASSWLRVEQRPLPWITGSILSRQPSRFRHPVVSAVRNVSIFHGADRNIIQPNVAPLVMKKRPSRKKRPVAQTKEGKFDVIAYATAHEYDLDGLHLALIRTNHFVTRQFYADPDQEVLHIQLKQGEWDALSAQSGEPQEVFFFREGSTVLWNCSDEQTQLVWQYLRAYEINPYMATVVEDEKEIMDYAYAVEGQGGGFKKEMFWLPGDEPNDLYKYTYSNAMTSSVKLAIWEAMLNEYIDGLAAVTSDLKNGKSLRISRAAVLRKTGELFELKHLVNLNSELLGTPDFYWEHESLEKLFTRTCHYFSIPKRKRVINEKIHHCIELTELVSSNLNDSHHVRLEWMIIVLIMVEVAFETLHYIDRIMAVESNADDSDAATPTEL